MTLLELFLKRGPRKSPKLRLKIYFQEPECYFGLISSMHSNFERYRWCKPIMVLRNVNELKKFQTCALLSCRDKIFTQSMPLLCRWRHLGFTYCCRLCFFSCQNFFHSRTLLPAIKYIPVRVFVFLCLLKSDQAYTNLFKKIIKHLSPQIVSCYYNHTCKDVAANFRGTWSEMGGNNWKQMLAWYSLQQT